MIFGMTYFVNAFTLFDFENPLLKFVFEYGFHFFLGIEVYRFISSNDWQSKIPSKIVSYAITMSLIFITIALGEGEGGEKGIINFDAFSHLSASALSVFSIMNAYNDCFCFYIILHSYTHKHIFF